MTKKKSKFDIFLAHNSNDKPFVKEIASKLQKRKLKPWLDEEQIAPGKSFQDEIQQAIPVVKSAAIFVGSRGLGKWQEVELRSFISMCVEKEIPVIPVLLPNVKKLPKKFIFLKEYNWVSFRSVDDEEALDKLEWGITGRKPEPVTKEIKDDSVDQTQVAQPRKINILHLSDLHFGTQANARLWYNQLAEDIKNQLKCSRLDILILSGDIANKSTPTEYKAAEQFLKDLCQEFQLDIKQVIIVPGNHDVHWLSSKNAYSIKRIEDYNGLLDEKGCPDTHYAFYRENENYIEVINTEKHKQRFKNFRNFYEVVKGEQYPLEYSKQGILHHFPEYNLLILGLNSAWESDHHYKYRASIHSDALNDAIDQISQNSELYRGCLKFAVWHHSLVDTGNDELQIIALMQKLAQAGFSIVFNGHIHKAEADKYRPKPFYIREAKVNTICAGTFGALTREWKPNYPLQYNFLEVVENKLIVQTRCRKEPNGNWKPDDIWKPSIEQDTVPLSFYEIILPEGANTRYIQNSVELKADKSKDTIHQPETIPSVEQYTFNQPQTTPNVEDERQNAEAGEDFDKTLQHLEEVYQNSQISTKKNFPVKKVLIIAACPKNTLPLRLGEEIRGIQEALRKSKKFHFVVEVRWAARVKDVREALLEYEPHIVHFCGHGVGEDGLVLEDQQGNAHLVSPKVLAELLQMFSEHLECLIECIVLSTCYSEVQANAIKPYTSCIVGMSSAVSDKAAIKFAEGFYLGLANGINLDLAFKLGKNAIKSAGISEELVPILKKSDAVARVVRNHNEAISRNYQNYSDANEKVLVIVANPIGMPSGLRLEEEVREIYAVLTSAREKGQVALEQRWAARFDDFEDALFEFQPTIVHFSGYGQQDGLFFEDEIGQPRLVRTQQISNLIKYFSEQIKCVFINTSYSQVHAQEIVKYIDYAIGFPNGASTDACIDFAKGFYKAIGQKRSYKQAYDFARNKLDQYIFSENDFPILNTKG